MAVALVYILFLVHVETPFKGMGVVLLCSLVAATLARAGIIAAIIESIRMSSLRYLICFLVALFIVFAFDNYHGLQARIQYDENGTIHISGQNEFCDSIQIAMEEEERKEGDGEILISNIEDGEIMKAGTSLISHEDMGESQIGRTGVYWVVSENILDDKRADGKYVVIVRIYYRGNEKVFRNTVEFENGKCLFAANEITR